MNTKKKPTPKKKKKTALKQQLSQCCSAPIVLSFPGLPNSGYVCTACLSLTRPR